MCDLSLRFQCACCRACADWVVLTLCLTAAGSDVFKTSRVSLRHEAVGCLSVIPLALSYNTLKCLVDKNKLRLKVSHYTDKGEEFSCGFERMHLALFLYSAECEHCTESEYCVVTSVGVHRFVLTFIFIKVLVSSLPELCTVCVELHGKYFYLNNQTEM